MPTQLFEVINKSQLLLNVGIKTFLLLHQKLLTYQITVMRGIQINNYFNNHITLNGKKINQDPQAIVQNTRQKLQNNPIHAQEQSVPENKVSPNKNHPAPLKKRTNTLVQLKKHLPQKRSISVQRQRNGTSAKKKEELVSDQEQKQEQPLINMSHKKFKPNPNKGGLGKRSKSTIIKTNHIEQPKEFIKKQSKKLNSNPTVQSAKPLKSKRKKSSKISEVVKQNKQAITSRNTTARKEIPQTASKQVFKKDKLVLKIDKNIKHEKTQKKSARNAKNTFNIPKSSKPVSARQKKIKKNRFIEELKEKYENQTILQAQLSSSRLKNNQDQGIDTQFLSVMNSLQKILNSVGSKQKLKKELDIINEKLREFKLQTEQEYQLNEESSNTHKDIFEEKIRSIEQKINSQQLHEKRGLFFGQKDESQEQEEQESEEEPLPHKISQQDQIYMRLEEQQVKNPLIGKRNNIFFVQQKEDNQEVNERKKQIELLKKFKGESTKMMEKVGLNNNINTHTIEIEQLKPQRKLTLQNVSLMSSNSHKWEDKYPQAGMRSPKFDESQILSAIQLKQKFISSKHDKISELVKKMFEKQLVSPRSYENQLKSLNKKYEEENLALQSFKKQAEQLSSMLSQIKKDKEQIQGIDELIRNQKWQQAQKYVEKKQTPLQRINENDQYQKINDHEDCQKKWQKDNEEHIKKFQLTGWEKESGWQRVKIKKSDVQNNEFVDIGQMTNRGRKKAQPNIEIDIDQQCGGTQQSQQLQAHEVRPQKTDEDQYIYYNEDNDSDKNDLEGGLIRLVQIPQESNQQSSKSNNKIFHIKNQQPQKESQGIQKSNSVMSVPSQPQRGGFTTNLYFIKEYCIAICQFVRDNEFFKSQFKSNVSKPVQFNILHILKQFRHEDSSNYVYSKRFHKPAIADIIWSEFNSQYQTLKFNSNHSSLLDAKISQKYKQQKELQTIFIKMIYDVLNQSLDCERPGGIFGKALPWRETARHLKNLKQLKDSQGDNVQAYDLMFGVAIARIIQWGSCLCGFLPDTVQLQNTEIDEAYVNHIRQTRTAFLLQKMMAEQEVIMTNFELQQAQVQYRLSQLIYQQLLQQAGRELNQFFKQ